jgi:hypothetical protein
MSADFLLAWLGIIALGARVVSHGQPPGLGCGDAYDASYRKTPGKVCFTARFKRKHPHLVKAFTGITARPGSKWQVVVDGPGVRTVDELRDLHSFLLAARRYADPNRVGGRYATAVASPGHNAGCDERATRYGNWAQRQAQAPAAGAVCAAGV